MRIDQKKSNQPLNWRPVELPDSRFVRISQSIKRSDRVERHYIWDLFIFTQRLGMSKSPGNTLGMGKQLKDDQEAFRRQ